MSSPNPLKTPELEFKSLLVLVALASLGALAKTPDDRALIRDAFVEYR